jgi:hypothetical protein
MVNASTSSIQVLAIFCELWLEMNAEDQWLLTTWLKPTEGASSCSLRYTLTVEFLCRDDPTAD